MQLKLWIDDDNYLTVNMRVQNIDDGSPEGGVELSAVYVEDKKLSNITEAQILDLAGQVADALTTIEQAPPAKEDWRDAFRRNDKQFFDS